MSFSILWKLFYRQNHLPVRASSCGSNRANASAEEGRLFFQLSPALSSAASEINLKARKGIFSCQAIFARAKSSISTISQASSGALSLNLSAVPQQIGLSDNLMEAGQSSKGLYPAQSRVGGHPYHIERLCQLPPPDPGQYEYRLPYRN